MGTFNPTKRGTMPKQIFSLLLPLVVMLFGESTSFERRRQLTGLRNLPRTFAYCQGTSFPCDVGLAVIDVRYAGKKTGRDIVKVTWTFSTASPCFSNPIQNFQSL